MTKFVYLCGEMEGFGKPGEIPTVRNNRMDLKHSPHSTHPADDPNGIGHIDTVEHGDEDAERQAALWASRGLTLEQAIQKQTGWTPETGDVEGNNTQRYLQFVSKGLGMAPSTLMTEVLLVDMPQAT